MESMCAIGNWAAITVDGKMVAFEEESRSASLLKALSRFDDEQMSRWLTYYVKTWLVSSDTKAFAEDFGMSSELVHNNIFGDKIIVRHGDVVVRELKNMKNFKGALLSYIRYLAHDVYVFRK